MKQEFRTIPPPSHEVYPAQLLAPHYFKLDNGIPVYIVNAGTEDIIKFDLVFDAGSFYQSQPLVASLCNKCLQEGTSNFTAKTIATTVDYYGAHLRAAATKDDSRLSLYCLGKHFDKLLFLVHEVAFEPLFPVREVKTIVDKSHREWEVNMEKVNYVAQANFPRLIFGADHPYASRASAEDFKRLNRDLLADFHQQFFVHRPFKIIISGKVPEQIKHRINAIFGQMEIKKNTWIPHITDPGYSKDPQHLIAKENALQSAVRIGKVLFNKHHSDYIKMKIVSTILGGYFGSRLMTNIREDKGYTYGIGAMTNSLKYAGMFTIASEVGVDVREKAMDEIFKEINKLRNQLVDDSELKLVKNYMLGSFMRSADGPFALSELVKSVVDYDLDMDYFVRYQETIKNISAKEIRELAVKYLDPASMITLVVGK